jgi:hypothetical protein
MSLDRRQILVGAIALAGTIGISGSVGNPAPPDLPITHRLWHPLTRELLDRARRVEIGHREPDRLAIEENIRDFAERTGYASQPVIKWMADPADAFDHLSGLGLDELLRAGTASFCRAPQTPVPCDEAAFERWFEVRRVANGIMNVEARDRALMAPKLLAKSRTASCGASQTEIFHARAVSAQIGWLETSMADAAAQAVSNIELLLSASEAGCSVAIDNQLLVFELYEYGLLTTWEKPEALVCIPRSQA